MKQVDFAVQTRTGTIVCTYDNLERARQAAQERGLQVVRRTVTLSVVADRIGPDQ